jgi:hypothetical protein
MSGSAAEAWSEANNMLTQVSDALETIEAFIADCLKLWAENIDTLGRRVHHVAAQLFCCLPMS